MSLDRRPSTARMPPPATEAPEPFPSGVSSWGCRDQEDFHFLSQGSIATRP